ncbi:MAG TPA: hypothetical protein VFN35_06415 [Ktedonobacteraceae bacterium]|nr:hypothetical protein [Ktedonobacteraceae bacterium]
MWKRQGLDLWSAARNSKNYIQLLQEIEADNLSSHNGLEMHTWLADHPRILHVFIPKDACPAQSPGGLVTDLPP